jgi:hypothetical protein
MLASKRYFEFRIRVFEESQNLFRHVRNIGLVDENKTEFESSSKFSIGLI